MAARNGDLEPEIGRELCRVRRDSERRGYRKDILTENLSERDSVFVCNRCKAILREVCISGDGEQFCSCCKEEEEQTSPNIHVSNMIMSFKCSCPLMARGCGWLGTLGGCEDHLETCGYVRERCEFNCREVLQRNEIRIHETKNCPLRIVKCEHCHKEFKSCELATHLETCPKMKVSCEQNCGKVMCRENITHHLKQYCGLVVETCKLGCAMKLTRDELRTHVTNCVQRLIACEHCKKDFKFCDMPTHLDMCPKMKGSCGLCGTVMCRKNITRHIEQNCPEKEIECLFAKHKCEVIVKRKDLDRHLEEKKTEHLELKLNAMEELITKQNGTIEKQKEKIEELNSRISGQNQGIKKSQQIANLEEEYTTFKTKELIRGECNDIQFWSFEVKLTRLKKEVILHERNDSKISPFCPSIIMEQKDFELTFRICELEEEFNTLKTEEVKNNGDFSEKINPQTPKKTLKMQSKIKSSKSNI